MHQGALQAVLDAPVPWNSYFEFLEKLSDYLETAIGNNNKRHCGQPAAEAATKNLSLFQSSSSSIHNLRCHYTMETVK